MGYAPTDPAIAAVMCQVDPTPVPTQLRCGMGMYGYLVRTPEQHISGTPRKS